MVAFGCELGPGVPLRSIHPASPPLPETRFRGGTLLDLRTNTSQNCEAVPRRAVFKAHRLLHPSILGARVIMKKKKGSEVRHIVQGLKLIISIQGLRRRV